MVLVLVTAGGGDGNAGSEKGLLPQLCMTPLLVKGCSDVWATLRELILAGRALEAFHCLSFPDR